MACPDRNEWSVNYRRMSTTKTFNIAARTEYLTLCLEQRDRLSVTHGNYTAVPTTASSTLDSIAVGYEE